MSENAAVQAPDTRSMAMIRTLGIIATISGLLVVMVFELTKPAIEANKQALIQRAVFQVIPGATQRQDFVVSESGIEPLEGTTQEGITIYAGYDDSGALKGIAAEGAAQGYADVIRLLYGYSPSCECITGIRVLKLSETPGLGDKIITDEDFVANFDALEAKLNAEMSALANAITTVKHGSKDQPWEIDAISGATISSVAVGKAINNSAQHLLPLIVPRIEEIKTSTQRRKDAENAKKNSPSNASSEQRAKGSPNSTIQHSYLNPLRPSRLCAMCKDSQVPRWQDAKERPFAFNASGDQA